MRKKNFFSFLIVAILLVGISPTLVIASSEVNSEVSSQHDNLLEVQLYTETQDIIEKDIFNEVFTPEYIKFLKENFNTKINYSKDYVEIKIKTKIKPSSENDLILYADGRPIKVNSNGTILVDKDTETISKTKPSHDNHTQELNNYEIHSENYRNTYRQKNYNTNLESFNKSGIEIKNDSNKPEAVFTANSGDLLAVMDEKEENFLNKDNINTMAAHKGYGDKYYTGDWVHCNRFNGYGSDGVHYNWRTGSAADKARAIKNFYSSDCHIALVQAGSGCTSVGSCQCNTNKRAAYCSGFTKDKNNGDYCSYTYHKHSGLVVPR